MLILGMRRGSHSWPAWNRLTKIYVHLKLSADKFPLFRCQRVNRLKVLYWSRLKYLVLSDSNKISFELCIRNWTSELLWLRCGRSSLSYTHFLGSCLVCDRNFSFIYKLVVRTGCVFLILLAKCIALGLFVHAGSTRRYQIMLLLVLFFFWIWSWNLRLILLVSVILCSEDFVKVYSFVVHLVKVTKLFRRLLKVWMLWNIRLRMGRKSDEEVFVSLIWILTQNLTKRGWAFNILVFSQ